MFGSTHHAPTDIVDPPSVIAKANASPKKRPPHCDIAEQNRHKLLWALLSAGARSDRTVGGRCRQREDILAEIQANEENSEVAYVIYMMRSEKQKGRLDLTRSSD